MTSNGFPANDFLYFLPETVINVILTKFVRCPDSDLLYFSKIDSLLPGFAYSLATMPAVLLETLLCCITLHCVVRFG